MRFWLKVTAILVLLAVLYVLVYPFVNLDPTALRAWRAALSLAGSMTAAFRLLAGLLALTFVIFLADEVSPLPPGLEIRSLTCVQLC